MRKRMQKNRKTRNIGKGIMRDIGNVAFCTVDCQKRDFDKYTDVRMPVFPILLHLLIFYICCVLYYGKIM